MISRNMACGKGPLFGALSENRMNFHSRGKFASTADAPSFTSLRQLHLIDVKARVKPAWFEFRLSDFGRSGGRKEKP
jgi:hypothetical protein